jgi:hypothetical protein
VYQGTLAILEAGLLVGFSYAFKFNLVSTLVAHGKGQECLQGFTLRLLSAVRFKRLCIELSTHPGSIARDVFLRLFRGGIPSKGRVL